MREDYSGFVKAWLSAFLASAIGATLGLVLTGISKVTQWLTAAGRFLFGEIQHVMNSMWARGLNFFSITGIAFTFVDFAFMATYLSLYLSSI